jgi:hypothetical protein
MAVVRSWLAAGYQLRSGVRSERNDVPHGLTPGLSAAGQL